MESCRTSLATRARRAANRRAVRGLAHAVVLAFITVACGPVVEYITVPSTASITPSSNEANVVIVQPNTRFN
jgi:hypothetical protein